MKKNWLNESVVAFKKIDKIVSKTLLYYCSIFGFILGWVSLGIIFLSISDTIPLFFVLLLRVFYFLISFLFGLKITVLIINRINYFRKRF